MSMVVVIVVAVLLSVLEQYLSDLPHRHASSRLEYRIKELVS